MTRYSESLARLLACSTLVLLSACSVGPAVDGDHSSPVTASMPSTSAATSASRDIKQADLRFSEALQLMKNRQPQAAQAAFLALSKDFPEFSGPLTALGILYAQEKQRDQALASFARAAAANPGNAVAFNWLGSLYRENGNFSQAEDAYRKALAARKDYAPAIINLGILYDVAMHRPADALAEYREYQRVAGTDNLMVSVWIKEIEDASISHTASASDGVAGAQP